MGSAPELQKLAPRAHGAPEFFVRARAFRRAKRGRARARANKSGFPWALGANFWSSRALPMGPGGALVCVPFFNRMPHQSWKIIYWQAYTKPEERLDHMASPLSFLLFAFILSLFKLIPF